MVLFKHDGILYISAMIIHGLTHFICTLHLSLRHAPSRGLFNNKTRSPKGLRVNSPWAIDPWPLRAKGLTVLVSPNKSDRKGNNKVSKCKLKKYLFGGKNERKTDEFRYSMTITIRPLVA